MRKGFNPNKDRLQEPNLFFHQVVIPVYIPNQEGYFKESLSILKYCLQSLFQTSHSKTYYTIVNNGSCKEVVDYLTTLYQSEKIQEVIHTTNIGKLNAVLKGISGQQFPLITISDADVLFLKDWQKETYQIFEAFPKAGSVATTPNSKLIRHFTCTVLLRYLFSSQMRFTPVINPEAMQSFSESINNPNFFNEYHFKKYLSVSKGKLKAVLGGGHFVATYRACVFDNLAQRYSKYRLGGNSEVDFLDASVVKKGLWRLSTAANYTFHMGNTTENWMLKQLNAQCQVKSICEMEPQLKKVKMNDFARWFSSSLFSRILSNRLIWKLFLRFKGLSKEEANHY